MHAAPTALLAKTVRSTNHLPSSKDLRRSMGAWRGPGAHDVRLGRVQPFRGRERSASMRLVRTPTVAKEITKVVSDVRTACNTHHYAVDGDQAQGEIRHNLVHFVDRGRAQQRMRN